MTFPDRIWAADFKTWVEAGSEPQRFGHEREYVRSAVARATLLVIQSVLDAAPDEVASELWVSKDMTLRAYVAMELAGL